MNKYYANAKTEDLEVLSKGCDSIAEAYNVFATWKRCGYRLKETYVTDAEGKEHIKDITEW